MFFFLNLYQSFLRALVMRYIKWKSCLYFFWITMFLWMCIAQSIQPFPCGSVMFPIGCIKSRSFPHFFLPAGLDWVNVPNPHFISFCFFSSSFRISNHHFFRLLQRQDFLQSNVCGTKIDFLLCWFSLDSTNLSKISHKHFYSRLYFKESYRGSISDYLLGAVAWENNNNNKTT